MAAEPAFGFYGGAAVFKSGVGFFSGSAGGAGHLFPMAVKVFVEVKKVRNRLQKSIKKSPDLTKDRGFFIIKHDQAYKPSSVKKQQSF